MRLLMFNSQTGEVLATSAKKEGRIYQSYLDKGFVPVAYVEYFKTIKEIENN